MEEIKKAIDIEEMVGGLPDLINALAGKEELTPAFGLASSQRTEGPQLQHKHALRLANPGHDDGGPD